jgi:hypothetical protein
MECVICMGMKVIFIKLEFVKEYDCIEQPFATQLWPVFVHAMETLFSNISSYFYINQGISKEIGLFRSRNVIL